MGWSTCSILEPTRPGGHGQHTNQWPGIHLIECYQFVDDYLQSHPKVASWRRSNNSDPDITNAEVIVIA